MTTINIDRAADYDMSIHSNPDAQAWAKFFINTQLNTGFTIDEELMTAWFANAMMAMHDYLKQSKASTLEEIRGAVARCWCTPENSHKVMDATLALAISDSVQAALQSQTAHCPYCDGTVRRIDPPATVKDSLTDQAAAKPVAWANASSLRIAETGRERGGPYDQHTWSECKTDYHSVPLFTTPPATQAALARALNALWTLVEHNKLHFGESHNTVIQGNAAIAEAERVL